MICITDTTSPLGMLIVALAYSVARSKRYNMTKKNTPILYSKTGENDLSPAHTGALELSPVIVILRYVIMRTTGSQQELLRYAWLKKVELTFSTRSHAPK